MLPRVTLSGNLTRDPELRVTASGKSICSLTIATNDRKKVDGKWEDGDPCFVDVVVFGEDADVLPSAVSKGGRLTVDGRLQQRSFETRDGDRRTVFEVVAQLVTLPLPRATAARVRPTVPPIDPGDPWVLPKAVPPSGTPDDPWATPVGVAAAPADAAPPF